MKINFVQQKNNLLKNNLIVKFYDENEKFLFCIVENINEIERILRKKHHLKLSENILLSEKFLIDLIKIKLNKKEFLFL